MVRVASEWLATCGGCEVTILDIGEPLLDLLPQLQFVHMPVIMDHKYYGQTGEMEFNIPEADVGLISGSIRNEENARVAQEMRKKCKTLIAVGSCANFGGIPALALLVIFALATWGSDDPWEDPADGGIFDGLRDRFQDWLEESAFAGAVDKVEEWIEEKVDATKDAASAAWDYVAGLFS